MMLGALAWLLGSSIGRKVALTGVILAVVGVAVWRIYAAGQSAEKAKQTQASLENLRNRIETDDEISALPAAERKRRLSEWVSD